jgi:hypothetical protein
MPKVAKLLSQQHECTTGVVSFWYQHPGRQEATVDVSHLSGRVRYTSKAGNTSGWVWDSDALEKNPYPGYVVGLPRHQLLFRDMHSWLGVPQDIAFVQVGTGCWVGTHRKGDQVMLILKPQAQNIMRDFQRELADLDVIAMPYMPLELRAPDDPVPEEERPWEPGCQLRERWLDDGQYVGPSGPSCYGGMIGQDLAGEVGGAEAATIAGESHAFQPLIAQTPDGIDDVSGSGPSWSTDSSDTDAIDDDDGICIGISLGPGGGRTWVSES